MSTRVARLMNDLRGYTPADSLESSHHCAIAGLLGSDLDPLARTTFAPGHITASLFIIDSAGRLLLHHHRRLGRWLQMGGHVEPGEQPLDAALREGREESGLSDLKPLGGAIFDVDVHTIPAAKGEPEHRHYDVRYLARTETPDLIMIDPAESNDLTWTTLDSAVVMMNEEASSRVIRKIGTFISGRTQR